MEEELMAKAEEQLLKEKLEKEKQLQFIQLQPLLEEYDFRLTLEETWILREREMFWWGNEDIECILELAKMLKFFNLCGEGNRYKIKSAILNDEINKIKGWSDEIEFKSDGVYRIIYNELAKKLTIFYDYNILNLDEEEDCSDDLDKNEDLCEFQSEFERTYGELCFFSNEELDVIIEEYEFRKRISPDEYGFMSKFKGTSSARLGKIASMICCEFNDKRDFREATKVKQYSFVYDLFVLYGLISVKDGCVNGFSGYVGKEKYQCVKNWIYAYKTFKQKVESFVKERIDKQCINSQK